ncbi:universal stress protein [Desulfogranum marinum]|jgi:nucleotide-binding universal stress UspA family protein|uniref:universal stress protein n=1 Tax=Desulfogranum marinum TaxID=453220 RepID=UPI00196531F5|nr:universal stress protein [Desulfogranum marinum]MBM9511563.1 universal stress protein [Desulfogranum marinum]
MAEIKKILVPLAFSDFSKGILEYAAGLAKALDAELILINVINERDLEAVQTISSFGYDVDEEHYIQGIEKQRIEALEEMLAGIDVDEERVRFVFKVGRPATVLLKVAVQENVDMIVMGVKAKSELMHAFTGSVAEKLFRRSPITIVSYRGERIAEKLRKRITQ